MGPLRRLAARPAADWRLLAEAGLLLAAVRVGLWVLPFATLRRAVRRIGRARRGASPGGVDEARLVWALGAAGRVVPQATCLVRALAAQALLARHGQPSELRLGVARGPDGALLAHAWLERSGHVVVGGAVADRYVPLPPIERPS
jgi:hypothetical protein